MAVVKKNGTYVATRAGIDLIEGSNVTLTVTDDPTNNVVDITIASSGGGGGAVATDAIWDAAGDLAVGTGANTAAKLPIGTNGYVLTSNGTTAAWAAASAGASALDDLTDVTITSPATGATIIYNGSAWVDGQLNLADSDAVTGTLPVGNGGTGITSLGTGVATFLGTPSSANLSAAVTDETGSGALVFATSPTFVTPALGTPSSATLTNATGLPIATGVSGLGSGVATFAATPSSANLAAAVTDETGSGALVFATSPTLVTPALGAASATSLTLTTDLAVADGGTGASTAPNALTNLGAEASANKNVANGYAPLGSDVKVPLANLPTALSTLRFGRLFSAGHSYTQLGPNGTAAASVVDQFAAFPGLIAATLNVPQWTAWGKSGAQLTSPSNGDSPTVDNAGVGLWLAHLYPPHWYAASTGSNAFPTRPIGKASAALFIAMYGYNDTLRNSGGNTTVGPSAFLHALRTMLSRQRAAMLYSSTSALVAYTTGFATTTATPYPTSTSGVVTDASATMGQYRISKANADKFTITLPTDFTGGTFFVTMHASPGISCYIKTGCNNSTTTIDFKGSILGDLGYKALVAGDVVTVAAEGANSVEQITLGSTADGGITWTGCTRSGSPSAHGAGAVVTLPTTTGKITWSGTAAGTVLAQTGTTNGGSSVSGGTVTTSISGQGNSSDGVWNAAPLTNVVARSGIPVTQRFTLTSADAGKTIIGTVGGLVGKEYVGLDSFGIEDSDPPQSILVNQPDMRGVMPGGGIFFGSTVATAYNDTFNTIAAEFDASVAVVDIDTPFRSFFRGTLQAAITSSGQTNVHITPDSASSNIIGIGSVIRIVGGEEILVTAITKTSDSDWSLTVTRGYNGTSASSSTASGTYLMDCAWVNIGDRIHPSDYGHHLIAKYIFSTLTGLSRTEAQAINASAPPRLQRRMMNGGYYRLVQGGTRSSQSMTNGVEYCYQLEVTEDCVLNAIGCCSTTAVASTTLRGGVRVDAGGQPGYLIGELANTISGNVSSTNIEATGAIPLRPGIYWFVGAMQGATHTAIRGYAATTVVPANVPIAEVSIPATTTNSVLATGYSLAGATSGALPSVPPTASLIDGACPVLWARFSVPVRD